MKRNKNGNGLKSKIRAMATICDLRPPRHDCHLENIKFNGKKSCNQAFFNVTQTKKSNLKWMEFNLNG